MEGGERSPGNLFYASSSQCCQLDFGKKNSSYVKFKYDNPCEKRKKKGQQQQNIRWKDKSIQKTKNWTDLNIQQFEIQLRQVQIISTYNFVLLAVWQNNLRLLTAHKLNISQNNVTVRKGESPTLMC